MLLRHSGWVDSISSEQLSERSEATTEVELADDEETRVLGIGVSILLLAGQGLAGVPCRTWRPLSEFCNMVVYDLDKNVATFFSVGVSLLSPALGGSARFVFDCFVRGLLQHVSLCFTFSARHWYCSDACAGGCFFRKVYLFCYAHELEIISPTHEITFKEI